MAHSTPVQGPCQSASSRRQALPKPHHVQIRNGLLVQQPPGQSLDALLTGVVVCRTQCPCKLAVAVGTVAATAISGMLLFLLLMFPLSHVAPAKQNSNHRA